MTDSEREVPGAWDRIREPTPDLEMAAGVRRARPW